jgi:hypothetical protein
MTDDAGLTDALVARLKARAADPARRLDQRPTQFIAHWLADWLET